MCAVLCCAVDLGIRYLLVWLGDEEEVRIYVLARHDKAVRLEEEFVM